MKIFIFCFFVLSPFLVRAVSPSFSDVKKQIDITQDLLVRKLNAPLTQSEKEQILADFDESFFSNIEKKVLIPFFQSLKNQDGVYKKFLAPKVSFWGHRYNLLSSLNQNDIAVSSWRTKETRLSDFTKDLKAFEKIFDLRVDFTQINIDGKFRKKNYSYDEFEALGFFDLRGTYQNMRIHDRGNILVSVKKIAGKWLINRIQFFMGKTLTKKRATYQLVKFSSDIFTVYPSRYDSIFCREDSLSIMDFDNDGLLDIFTGDQAQSILLKGDGKGNFTKIAASPITKVKNLKSSIFLDLNNDGKSDFFGVQFQNPSIRGSVKEYELGDLVIFENKGDGNFLFKNAEMFYMPKLKKMFPSFADYDADGMLDVFLGFPGYKKNPNFYEMNAQHLNGQFKNIMNMNFKHFELPNKKNPKFQFTSDELFYPVRSISLDLDRDGDIDILVQDELGNLSPFFENTGHGKFVYHHFPITDFSDEFSVGANFDVGDINNDGFWDIISTKLNFHASNRIYHSSLANLDAQYSVKGRSGLQLFLGSAKNGFAQQSKISFDMHPGEAVIGAKFLDYNNDGLLDIYVINGLWTSDKKSEDISSLFIRGLGTGFDFSLGDQRDDYEKSDSLLLNFLSSDKEKLSLAGSQRNRLYLNNGDLTFTEVAFLEGVDSSYDGRSVAIGDLNGDGILDFVLRNCDPFKRNSTDRPLEVFLSNKDSQKKSLRMKLLGTSTNRDAIGAIVEASLSNGVKIHRFIYSGTGGAQSEILIHFGLGEFSKAEEVRVIWPSGKKTNLKNVSAGKYELNENETQLKINIK